MRTKLFCLLLCALCVSAAPTVTSISFDGGSHSTVGVKFSVTGVSGISNARVRYVASPATCTGGTGGFVQTNSFGPGDFNLWFIRLNVAGLASETSYQFCPEVSTDGGKTWSSGAGATWKTASLPTVHPALPIPPATFNSDYPDTSAYDKVSMPPNCAGFEEAINKAIANLGARGTVISIPAGTVCSQLITLPVFPDIINYNAASVSNGAIQVPNHGLSEGQGIVFGLNNYAGHIPGGIVDGYLYRVHVLDANSFQLFYGGTASAGGQLVKLSPGTGKQYFVKWPRPLKTLVIRTATPDDQFTPEHVRTGPQWAPKMAVLQLPLSKVGLSPLNITFRTTIDPNTMTMAANIRFVGIEFTSADNSAEQASNPLTWQGFLETHPTDSTIILDRCYIHGQPFPNRYATVINLFDGMDNAIIDSYWDNLDFWHATSSGLTPAVTSPTSFTVSPGQVNYGASRPGVISSPLAVHISGQPSAAPALQGAVFFDMSGRLTVGVPAGISVTASGAPIAVVNVRPGNSACNYTDTVFPQDSKGRMAAGPMACFAMKPDGTLSGIKRADPYPTLDLSEGCQAFKAGVGPGPFKIVNNYIEGTGLVMHFDNAGGSRLRGDYLVQKNTFRTPMEHMYGGPQSNGYRYGHRQPLEWKGGQRIKVDGNVFDGTWSEVTPSSVFIAITPRDGGYVTDVDVTNNTFQHGPGGINTIYAIDAHTNPGSMPGLRFRAKNNVFSDINGWKYATTQAGTPAGVGWLFEGGEAEEDTIIDHNTFLDNRGRAPYLLSWDEYPTEGMQITNNVFFFDQIGAIGASNYPAPCSGLKDKQFMDCDFTSGPRNPKYEFSGNVIVPSWADSSKAVGQVSTSTVSGALGSLVSRNRVSRDRDVPSAVAAFGGPEPRPQTGYFGAARVQASPSQIGAGAAREALLAAQGHVRLYDSSPESVTSNSASISFAAPDSSPCTVDYSKTDPTLVNNFRRLTDSSKGTARKIVLSNLEPASTYYYRVNCQSEQPKGQFKTR